jgi:hypothetical protein
VYGVQLPTLLALPLQLWCLLRGGGVLLAGVTDPCAFPGALLPEPRALGRAYDLIADVSLAAIGVADMQLPASGGDPHLVACAVLLAGGIAVSFVAPLLGYYFFVERRAKAAFLAGAAGARPGPLSPLALVLGGLALLHSTGMLWLALQMSPRGFCTAVRPGSCPAAGR